MAFNKTGNSGLNPPPTGFVVPPPLKPRGPQKVTSQPPTVPMTRAFRLSDDDDDDIENGERYTFTDKFIRLAFIRKVYGILTCQLAVTIAIVSIFVFLKPLSKFAREHKEFSWGFSAALLVLSIILACCGNLRRSFPINFILLGLYTVVEALALGFISACYDVKHVLMAIGVTAAVVLAITLFALQTKWDFTYLGGSLLVLSVVFLVFGIVCIFIPKNTVLDMVYSSIGALLFSVFLVFDTQMMLGGQYHYSTNPEEYIFAALNLYIDIVMLYRFILNIFGVSDF